MKILDWDDLLKFREQIVSGYIEYESERRVYKGPIISFALFPWSCVFVLKWLASSLNTKSGEHWIKVVYPNTAYMGLHINRKLCKVTINLSSQECIHLDVSPLSDMKSMIPKFVYRVVPDKLDLDEKNLLVPKFPDGIF